MEKKILLNIIKPSASPCGYLLEMLPFQGDFPVTSTDWELLFSHLDPVIMYFTDTEYY